MELSSSALRVLAVKSAVWYGGTRLWFQLLSWIITIALARLLAPADYGLFAMALSVLALLELLQEFGLGTAIVQRPDLTRQQTNAVFWTVATGSVLLTAATFLSAGAIASFYSEPRLVWTLRILCLTFFLNSLGMVPYHLLTRSIDLRRRSLAEAIGSGTSALLTLGLAYHGYGVWALVLGHLGRAIVFNLALALFARWVPSFDVQWEGMRGVMAFGLRVAGTHLIGNSSFTVNTFLLARFLGDVGLGLYTMAQSLAEAPHRISTAIINQVSLPLFSRLQEDVEVLGTYFLRISKYLAVVALPVQAGLVLVAPDVVPVVLSEKWLAIVVPFQLLCLESALVVLTLTSSPLLIARGRASLLLSRSVLSLTAMALAVLAGLPFGLVGVTAARLIAMLPVRLSILLPSLRELGLPLSGYVANLTAPLAATGVMSLVVLAIQRGAVGEAGHLERLVVAGASGAAVYLAALLVMDRRLGSEVRTMARDLFASSRA